MKIIGHRGAAGHELENTLASLQHAAKLAVWAIEFDVRKTKDGQLVVFHDADLKRVADDHTEAISELTLRELESVPLITGSHIPTLAEALEVIGSKRAIIEIKETGCAQALLHVLSQFPNANVIIASFKHNELTELRQQRPDLTLYGLERTRPFDIVPIAKQLHLNGIGLNHWLLNPLTYFLSRRAGLEMYVYTVDSRFLAAFMALFYPKVALCTNYPKRLLRKRSSSS